MFQKFYTNTIESNYIKYILQNTYIPTIPFVENINHVTKNQLYIFEKYIVRAKKSEEVNEILYQLKNDRSVYTRYFEKFDAYIFGKRYPGITTNYISNTGMYDPETHYYLGQYLRAYKAYYNVDLMPFYNCFSDEYLDNISLVKSTKNIPPFISYKNQSNQNYKIISVPISFCQEYTIAIDSDQEILCVPVFIGKKGILSNLTDKLHNILQLSYHKNLHLRSNYIINKATFKSPFYFYSPCIPGTEDEEQLSLSSYEKYLRLLIRVPITNNSSIVILEGHYLNVPTVCDREVNLDLNELKTKLLNEDSIELNITNLDLNNQICENYSKTASVINSIICRNISRQNLSCSCITPDSSNYQNTIFNLKIDGQTYDITVKNIKRINSQVVKSKLTDNIEISLIDIFGRSNIFIVGDSQEFGIKLNSTTNEQLLNNIQNKFIQVDEYTKLIYHSNSLGINNNVNGILSDVLLSNGNLCLTFSAHKIPEGEFSTSLETYDYWSGNLTHDLNLVFTPNAIDRLKGNVEITDSVTNIRSTLNGLYEYVISETDSSVIDLHRLNSPNNVTIQLSINSDNNLLIRFIDLDPNVDNSMSIYQELIPMTDLSKVDVEYFLRSHNDDYSEHSINLDESLNTFANIVYADEAKIYLQINFNTAKDNVQINTLNNVPISHWAFSQGIASEVKIEQYLNSALITNLSLLKLNDHNSYAFTSRLYEYLIGNTIDNTNKFTQNIKFVQEALKLGADGIWTDELRIKVYNTIQEYLNKFELANIDDLNGFIDKDSEQILYTLHK